MADNTGAQKPELTIDTPQGTIVVPSVPAKVQTWLGYGFSVALALTPLVAWLATVPLDEGLNAALVAAGTILAGVTGKNRSDQAKALIESATVAAVSTPASDYIPPAISTPAPVPGVDVPAIMDEGQGADAALDVDGTPMIPQVEDQS